MCVGVYMAYIVKKGVVWDVSTVDIHDGLGVVNRV